MIAAIEKYEKKRNAIQREGVDQTYQRLGQDVGLQQRMAFRGGEALDTGLLSTL